MPSSSQQLMPWSKLCFRSRTELLLLASSSCRRMDSGSPAKLYEWSESMAKNTTVEWNSAMARLQQSQADVWASAWLRWLKLKQAEKLVHSRGPIPGTLLTAEMKIICSALDLGNIKAGWHRHLVRLGQELWFWLHTATGGIVSGVAGDDRGYALPCAPFAFIAQSCLLLLTYVKYILQDRYHIIRIRIPGML